MARATVCVLRTARATAHGLPLPEALRERVWEAKGRGVSPPGGPRGTRPAAHVFARGFLDGTLSYCTEPPWAKGFSWPERIVVKRPF